MQYWDEELREWRDYLSDDVDSADNLIKNEVTPTIPPISSGN